MSGAALGIRPIDIDQVAVGGNVAQAIKANGTPLVKPVVDKVCGAALGIRPVDIDQIAVGGNVAQTIKANGAPLVKPIVNEGVLPRFHGRLS